MCNVPLVTVEVLAGCAKVPAYSYAISPYVLGGISASKEECRRFYIDDFKALGLEGSAGQYWMFSRDLSENVNVDLHAVATMYGIALPEIEECDLLRKVHLSELEVEDIGLSIRCLINKLESDTSFEESNTILNYYKPVRGRLLPRAISDLTSVLLYNAGGEYISTPGIVALQDLDIKLVVVDTETNAPTVVIETSKGRIQTQPIRPSE